MYRSNGESGMPKTHQQNISMQYIATELRDTHTTWKLSENSMYAMFLQSLDQELWMFPQSLDQELWMFLIPYVVCILVINGCLYHAVLALQHVS